MIRRYNSLIAAPRQGRTASLHLAPLAGRGRRAQRGGWGGLSASL